MINQAVKKHTHTTSIMGERAHLSGVVALHLHILYLQIKQAMWRADLLLATERLLGVRGILLSFLAFSLSLSSFFYYNYSYKNTFCWLFLSLCLSLLYLYNPSLIIVVL